VAHLQAALREIEALPTIHADAGVESAAPAVIEPNKVSTKKTAGARPKAPR
jgi:hypothetical protein